MSTTTDPSILPLKRKAIDPYGRPGSLYNAYQDSVFFISIANLNRTSVEPNECPLCTLKSGNQYQNQHLIEFFDFNDEQRLSISLKLTPMKKMTSFINYHHQIDNYTRILHYLYVNQIEKLSDGKIITRDLTELSNLVADSTHVITSVTKGIDIYIIMQLPHEVQLTEKIDDVLRKMQSLMKKNQNDTQLTRDEINLLDKITDTSCYTNIEKLPAQSTIYTVYCYVKENKNSNLYLPIEYTLQPITCFYPKYVGKSRKFISLPHQLTQQIKHSILHLQNMLQQIDTSLWQAARKFSDNNQKAKLVQIKTKYSDLERQYKDSMAQLSKLVIDVRASRREYFEIHEFMDSEKQRLLQGELDNLMQKTKQLVTKEQSKTNFEGKQSEYYNRADNKAITLERNNKTEEKKNDGYVSRQCTKPTTEFIGNDRLNFDKINRQLGKDHQGTSKNESIKSEYPFSSSERHNILSSSIDAKGYNTNKSTDTSFLQREKLNEASSTIVKETINILLLGETGVGKSTFINALANYLEFDTLKGAESNKPVVLIPVSFMMTVGDNFEEKTVTFGNINNDINEDFNHPGQSVTQKCRSHVFTVKRNVKQELCIIDTPGFGDTRGIDQDELNMTHILEYLKNLTHLNAVCFLLKPNSSRLNIYFRSCFTQLLNFLGSNSLRNVIFCFTNTRSTFYAPGNTLPLLKEMFASLSIGDIPLKKENTYCFDSESFRYLVALQNGIDCSELDRTEYEKSWSISVKETNRLIEYICTNDNIIFMKHDYEEIEDVELQIVLMIRPMLETVRNILRNTVLWNMKSTKKSIELCSQVVHRSATLCLKCNQTIIDFDGCWITEDSPHEFQDTCLTCSCSSEKHIPIDYIIKYNLVDNSLEYRMVEMKEQLMLLCNTSAIFTYFLLYVACSTIKNEFLINLTRMIDEENDICAQAYPNYLNLQLMKDLNQFKEKYEKKLKEIVSNPVNKELTNINELIEKIRTIPMIEEQLIAIRNRQKPMMNGY